MPISRLISCSAGCGRGRARVRRSCRASAARCSLAWLLLRYGLRLVGNNWDVDTVTLFFTYGVVYAIVPVAAVADRRDRARRTSSTLHRACCRGAATARMIDD